MSPFKDASIDSRGSWAWVHNFPGVRSHAIVRCGSIVSLAALFCCYARGSLTFFRPVTLVCGHTACESCMAKYLRTQAQTQAQLGNIRANRISCPAGDHDALEQHDSRDIFLSNRKTRNILPFCCLEYYFIVEFCPGTPPISAILNLVCGNGFTGLVR